MEIGLLMAVLRRRRATMIDMVEAMIANDVVGTVRIVAMGGVVAAIEDGPIHAQKYSLPACLLVVLVVAMKDTSSKALFSF